MTRLERRHLRNGLLFCLPWLIGFSVFLLYPLVASAYYSMCDYSVLLDPVFVGLDNYRQMLSDPLFGKSLWNTAYYAMFSVGLGLVISLSLAMLLNVRLRGIAWYRTALYLPTLMPVVAASVLWAWMYNGESGILNSLLAKVGIEGPNWLADPSWAKFAMVLMTVWGVGNAMVIYLAGLQDVPVQLQEAAVIDGANWLQRLRHVTIPMISPVIYFNLIMGIIGSLQVFTRAYIMTGATGEPERSTLFYVLRLHNVAFQDLRMGYACAMAWVLFLIILALTLVLTRVSRKWVHYER
ncbi:MAG TPA: sugar ABC transporter permease [Phycisphaerae bacterium]|nr:sugar ABC transporter permease [Phycisphaerae bacterium]